jgi:hypothetical protein
VTPNAAHHGPRESALRYRRIGTVGGEWKRIHAIRDSVSIGVGVGGVETKRLLFDVAQPVAVSITPGAGEIDRKVQASRAAAQARRDGRKCDGRYINLLDLHLKL